MAGPSPDISVVIPCLNEADNAEAIAAAAAAELRKAGVTYEIIFIDNGSTDGTVDIIKGLCARDGNVRLIVNNQNYGQMRSPTHAIYQTSGAAVIGLCADFQDPPEMIGDFIAKWRAGSRIVLGVRHSEKMSMTMRVIRAVGYGFLNRFGDYRVIPNATGFGLYDREVVDTLKRWRDPEPFFRGMLVESGFSLETIPYHRPNRAGGASKNNFGTMLAFALTGLTSSSKKLLRAPLLVSILAFCFTGASGLAAVIAALLGASPWPLAILCLVMFLAGLNFLFLGLIGEQVRTIAMTVRNVPLVVERERVNFPEP